MEKKEEIWKFIKQNKSLFNEINSDVKCSICQNVLIDAQQSECSCSFCRECLIAYLENNNRCPGGDNCPEYNILLDENVSEDTRKNAKVRKIEIKCPVTNCEYRGFVEKIIDHAKLCEITKCPFTSIGCDFIKIGQLNVEEHMSDASIEHGKLIVDSTNKLKTNLEFTEQTQNNEINNLKRKYSEIDEKINRFESLTVDYENLKKEHCELQIKVRKTEEKLKKDDEEFKKFKLVYGKLALLFKKFKDENSVKEVQYNGFVKEMKEKCTKNDLENIQKVMKDEINKSTKRNFVWKIENVEQKRFDAKHDENAKSVSSDPFYNRESGYKLRLVFYPNGDGKGLNTHASLYLQIMKSEYDAVLEWPFNELVSFHIINTVTKEPFKSFKFNFNIHGEKFRYIYDQPSTECNRGLGPLQFISWSDLLLEANNLIKDGSIYIRVDFKN